MQVRIVNLVKKYHLLRYKSEREKRLKSKLRKMNKTNNHNNGRHRKKISRKRWMKNLTNNKK
jgi:hypothetical protein